MTSDAEKVAETFMEACNLRLEVAENGIEDTCTVKLPRFLLCAAEAHSAAGNYFESIKVAHRCRKLWADNDIIPNKFKYCLVLIGYNLLQKFYRLKSISKPFDEKLLLQRAKAYLEHRHFGDHRSSILAQVHYLLGGIDEAYHQLVIYLDFYLVMGPRICCACKDDKREIPKRCSICRSSHYCSPQCQLYDWKTDRYSGVRHKFLCPLLVYWREKWWGKLKGTNVNQWKESMRWREVNKANEILTDVCREKFKEFLETLIESKMRQRAQDDPYSIIADVD